VQILCFWQNRFSCENELNLNCFQFQPACFRISGHISVMFQTVFYSVLLYLCPCYYDLTEIWLLSNEVLVVLISTLVSNCLQRMKTAIVFSYIRLLVHIYILYIFLHIPTVITEIKFFLVYNDNFQASWDLYFAWRNMQCSNDKFSTTSI